MNKSSATIMAAALMLASSCTDIKQEGQGYEPIIGKQEITIKDGRLTPEALWAMGRIGSLSVSPDGKKIAYTVAYYSVPENKSHRVIYVMDADGQNNTLLTRTSWNEGEPQWIKGGTKIAFLCNESGGSQIWEMNPDGSERRIISDFKGDIEGFSFSPDGKKILFISQVKYGQRTADLYPDLPKASGIIVNDLMYKHWDEWVETIPHPFVADFDGNMMGTATDIMEGEPFEAPMKPFGGIEQLAWSSDSKQIAYTSRKKQGLAYAVSTDSDIYLYDLESKKTENLCKDYTESSIPATMTNAMDGATPQAVQLTVKDENKGYDINPKFSPDGKYIAWQSMERDGYESDRNRLCVMDLGSKKKTYITESFESGVDDYCWNNNSQSLYFVGVWHGTSMIYSTNLNGEVKKLTDGMYDYGSVAMAGDKVITKRHSISAADEIYTLTPADGRLAQISHENDHIFNQLKLGKVEERWTKTTDGKQMLSWVIYPTNFDPNKKYPTLLFCEGGPALIVVGQQGGKGRGLGLAQFFFYGLNPIRQAGDFLPNIPQNVVGLFYPAVQIALVGGDALGLHLADGHALMDGGQQVKALTLIGAVVDAAGQPLFLKLGVHHSGPRLPPMFQCFRASPVGSGNSVKEGLAVLSHNAVPVLVQTVAAALLAPPFAVWLNGPDGAENMKVRVRNTAVLLVRLVDGKVGNHAPAHKLLRNKLPCKSDVFLQ